AGRCRPLWRAPRGRRAGGGGGGAPDAPAPPRGGGGCVCGWRPPPAWGGRGPRHWLDVARYAEDQAHTFGVKPKTQAWRYRDWVIAALNADMPYDQFVKLQIAGDLLPDAPEDAFTKYAGLGFLGLGAEYYKNTAKDQAIAEELDDRVDTLTRGLLGITVSCARCHDHKFDPIPQRDYYALAGIYFNTTLADAPLCPPEEMKAFTAAQ